MRKAYACFVFNAKTRRVEGWEVYSEPGELITCMGDRVHATIMEAHGEDFDEAERRVVAAMSVRMPGVPRGERLVAVDEHQDAAEVAEAMKVAATMSWLLGLVKANADEGGTKNFASVFIGGMRAPWDRATLTLHRPGGLSPEEAVAELQGQLADRDRTIAALEARVVELSEAERGR